MIQHKTFFYLTIILLVIEILIATLFKNTMLRPVFGDFLIVMLIYSFVRSVTPIKPGILAIAVLSLAYFVELLQRFNISSALGIPKNTLYHLTLGHSFDWYDMLAYTIGVVFILLADKYFLGRL